MCYIKSEEYVTFNYNTLQTFEYRTNTDVKCGNFKRLRGNGVRKTIYVVDHIQPPFMYVNSQLSGRNLKL